MKSLLRFFALLVVCSAALAAPAKERNVTFISTSDAHYDAFENEDRNGRNRETVQEINRIAGQTWPEQLGGGTIDKPRGVLLLGDVIDDGDRQIQGKTQGDRQYAAFLADFGLDGTDALLKYPVFEGWGNHDGPPAGKEKFGFSFQAQLKKRNEIRKARGLVANLSSSGMHYSWDWDDVHLVQLNLYAADKQREGVRYSPVWHDPQMSLSFLKEDLAKNVGDSGRPVVLMTHCGVDTDWWVAADWKDFYDVAKGYNVVLYLYGHSGTGIRQWAPPGEEKKWLCINDGQTENGFFLIQITGDRLRAGQRVKENVKRTKNPDKTETREWDGTWGWKWLVEKSLTGDGAVKTPTGPAPKPAVKTEAAPAKPQPAPAAPKAVAPQPAPAAVPAAQGAMVRMLDRPDTAAPRNTLYAGNREPLLPSPLIKLPVSAIRPHGWLKKQLELEADGFIGHLTEISSFCRREGNAWLSAEGKGHSGWEEVPYWFRGSCALGYILGDKRIIDESKPFIETLFASQREDGYFGPRANLGDGKGPDCMPNMSMLAALQAHYEATGDQRVIELMKRYFRWQLSIPDNQFFSRGWQVPRGGDNMASVHWLYNVTGEKWLLELAEKLQRCGSSWMGLVTGGHNVDFSQGFRKPAQFYPQSHDAKHLEASERNWESVMGLYGQVPGGLFGGDEFARPGYGDPRQAIETCGIVEMMRSELILLRITGEGKWADRAENAAINSLPASMTADQKALRYLTSANQVNSDKRSKNPELANGGPMQVMNPHDHRCCQHNVGMGWPEYVQNLWQATPGNGLAAVLYAACEVKAKVGDGTEVTITEQTEYPFDGRVEMSFAMQKPVRFPLHLRIPEWCAQPRVSTNGEAIEVSARPGAYVIIDRQWSSGDKLELTLPMEVRLTTWEKNQNSVSVHRGPVTFSLKIGEKYVRAGGTDAWPAWEIVPTTAWNYGLALDPGSPAGSFEVVRKAWPQSGQPFALDDAPVELKARARKIPNWKEDYVGLVDRLQPSPVKSAEPVETVTLIPMGAARLRIAAFPTVGDGPGAREWALPAEPMASYHRGGGADPISAINDGRIPASSYDTRIPRFTWWGRDQKGKKQWVQQNLSAERVVSSCEVYWFDETPAKADCRVPESWRLLYKEGNEWKEVKGASGYGIEVDKFNAVTFEPVRTAAMRLEVQCQKGHCAGVLEWRILPAGPDDAKPAAPAQPAPAAPAQPKAAAPKKLKIEVTQAPQPPLPPVAVPGALVLLDAGSLAEGPLTAWQNEGSLGREFAAANDPPLGVQVLAGRKAVVFPGESGLKSAFTAPAALAGNKPFSIEAWVYPERLVTKTVIASWASRPGSFAEFGHGHGREAVFASSAGRTGYNRPPAAKKWHHIVCAYVDGRLSVYVNGELNTQLAVNLATSPADAIHIGSAFDPAKNAQGFGYRGGIARLQIWDRALSHREVRNLAGDFAAFAAEPRDGSTLEARSAALRWQPGHADARGYRIQLATDRDALDRSALPDTASPQVDTGDLTLGKTYFWRILQLGASGQVLNAGPVISFTVSAGPAAEPLPRNRVAGVRTSVSELVWRPGRYAVSQDVHFGTDPDAVAASTAPVARNLPASATRLPMPAALEPGRTYYWRIDQNNGDLPPAKGEVWAFRTEDAPIANDVTFFVVSDTHYGLDPRGDELLPKLVDQMNWLPGTKLPDEVGGGIVRTPRGVIHCGDITAESRPEEWPPFVRDFGLNGEGRLAWPVYESYGNHDGGVDRIVRRSIKERNPRRTGLTRISQNGMHYSWDWDQVHFINLNISVGDTFHPYDPMHSYDFLVSELAQHGDKPLVLLQHMGFDKDSLNWWKEEDRQRYHAAIKDRNILGIFHGHDHNTRIFKWNGIDIYNLPHMQISESNPDEPAAHGFFVVRITPTEMIVAERHSDGTWGISSRKTR